MSKENNKTLVNVIVATAIFNSLKDETFKSKLMERPKEVLKEMRLNMPNDINVIVKEGGDSFEKENTLVIIIPEGKLAEEFKENYTKGALEVNKEIEEMDLGDDELENAAGGTSGPSGHHGFAGDPSQPGYGQDFDATSTGLWLAVTVGKKMLKRQTESVALNSIGKLAGPALLAGTLADAFSVYEDYQDADDYNENNLAGIDNQFGGSPTLDGGEVLTGLQGTDEQGNKIDLENVSVSADAHAHAQEGTRMADSDQEEEMEGESVSDEETIMGTTPEGTSLAEDADQMQKEGDDMANQGTSNNPAFGTGKDTDFAWTNTGTFGRQGDHDPGQHGWANDGDNENAGGAPKTTDGPPTTDE